jgi:hypothetical protein
MDLHCQDYGKLCSRDEGESDHFVVMGYDAESVVLDMLPYCKSLSLCFPFTVCLKKSKSKKNLALFAALFTESQTSG